MNLFQYRSIIGIGKESLPLFYKIIRKLFLIDHTFDRCSIMVFSLSLRYKMLIKSDSIKIHISNSKKYWATQGQYKMRVARFESVSLHTHHARSAIR